MRALSTLVVVTLFIACGSSDDSPPDGGPQGDAGGGKDAVADVDPGTDAGSDANLDAAHDADGAPDASTCPKVLLVGGKDVTQQGWTVTSIAQDASLTYVDDYTYLKTSTKAGARTSGQLLLHIDGAFEPSRPFRVEVVMRVEAVNPHNQYDSAAAILGSFTAPVGNQTERGQMVYLDANQIGWAANDMPPFPVSVIDGAYHTYEFSLDDASVARVRVDGVTALTRNAFVSNGRFAIGDQTNDVNIDSTIRIRSVTKLCP